MPQQFVVILSLLLCADFLLADQVVVPDYATARDKYFYRELYPSGGKTIYCEANFTNRRGLNVEHVLPASWMKRAAGCSGYSRNECRRVSDRFNLMEADLHNLFPSLAKVNSDRSNYVFAIIGSDDAAKSYSHNRAPGGKCDFEINYDDNTVEPRQGARGEIARAVFYMVKEYSISLDKELIQLLAQWNIDDPVSSIEESRNDKIEDIQNTRNPFIDDPGSVAAFATSQLAVLGGSNTQCLIKGNISRNGKIYHLPGSEYYDAVEIDESKGELLFCTESQAVAAGWRAAR